MPPLSISPPLIIPPSPLSLLSPHRRAQVLHDRGSPLGPLLQHRLQAGPPQAHHVQQARVVQGGVRVDERFGGALLLPSGARPRRGGGGRSGGGRCVATVLAAFPSIPDPALAVGTPRRPGHRAVPLALLAVFPPDQALPLQEPQGFPRQAGRDAEGVGQVLLPHPLPAGESVQEDDAQAARVELQRGEEREREREMRGCDGEGCGGF